MRLPDDCIRLAEPVPYPQIEPGEDMRLRTLKFAAGMKQANGTITAVRKCDIAVRDAADAAAK